MDDLKHWITFLGEGRSGHTIVSAILESHPNLRIGEERKSITLWYRDKLTKEAIFQDILESGLGKERKEKALPGSLEYTKLIGIGDKCGWDVPMLIKNGAPDDVMEQFEEFIGLPLKIIHTSRYPLENVASWFISPKWKRAWPDDDYRLRMLIRRYSRFYTRMHKALDRQNADKIFHLRNEELCLRPKETVKHLCDFLEIECDKAWLNMATSGILEIPNKRYLELDWNEKYVDMFYWRIIDKYPSLDYYRKGNNGSGSIR